MRFFLFILLFFFSFCARSVIVPLHFNQFSQPVIELQLDGVPVKFILDTGAGDALILTQADKSKLRKISETNSKARSIDLAGNISQVKTFIIPQVDINGMVFNDLQGSDYQPWGLVFSKKEKDEKESEMSVIGIDFFKKLRFTIDYRNLFLSFTQYPNDSNLQNSATIPFSITDEGVVISVKGTKKEYTMMVDTGSSFSALKKSIVDKSDKIFSCAEKKLDLPIDECKIVQVAVGNNSSTDNDISVVLMVGLPEQFIADGILGGNFFEKFSVDFDFQNKTLTLKNHHDDGNK